MYRQRRQFDGTRPADAGDSGVVSRGRTDVLLQQADVEVQQEVKDREASLFLISTLKIFESSFGFDKNQTYNILSMSYSYYYFTDRDTI